MKDKSELIKKLRDSIKAEESLVTIYSNHIKNVMAYSSMNKVTADEILAALDKLKGGCLGHKTVLNRLIESISNSDTDVY